jgi:hypothetical protein
MANVTKKEVTRTEYTLVVTSDELDCVQAALHAYIRQACLARDGVTGSILDAIKQARA